MRSKLILPRGLLVVPRRVPKGRCRDGLEGDGKCILRMILEFCQSLIINPGDEVDVVA